MSAPIDRTAVRLTVAILPALLVTVLGAPPAGAIPDPEEFSPPTVLPDSAAPPSEGPGRPCFMVQANWNDALDGPQPVC